MVFMQVQYMGAMLFFELIPSHPFAAFFKSLKVNMKCCSQLILLP